MFAVSQVRVVWVVPGLVLPGADAFLVQLAAIQDRLDATFAARPDVSLQRDVLSALASSRLEICHWSVYIRKDLQNVLM